MALQCIYQRAEDLQFSETIEELKGNVEEVAQCSDKNKIRRAVARLSVKKRAQLCLESKGGHFSQMLNP